MEREYKITPYQLFSILILIKIVTMLTYSGRFSGSDSVWNYTVSLLGVFILTFVLISPSYFMYKKFPNLNMFHGKLGFIYVIIYNLYFIFIACYFIGTFKIFITNVMAPYMPVSVLSVFILLLASYSSNKGMHAIARTSVIISFIIIVSLTFIYSSLFFKIDQEKFFPLLKNGISDTFNGILYLLSRNFGLSIFPIVVPFINGSLKKTICSWNILTCALSILTLTFAIGALGNYLETQEFPIYWATKVAELGVIKRLDAIYIGIFVSGMFILVATFLYFFKFVSSNLATKTTRKFVSGFAVLLIFLFGIFLPQSKNFDYFLYNKYVLLVANILVSFILPLVYFLKELYFQKKETSK